MIEKIRLRKINFDDRPEPIAPESTGGSSFASEESAIQKAKSTAATEMFNSSEPPEAENQPLGGKSRRFPRLPDQQGAKRWPLFRFTFKIGPKKKKILLISLLGLVLLIVTLGSLAFFKIWRPVKEIMAQIRELDTKTRQAKETISTKNLGSIKDRVEELNQGLNELNDNYQRLSWIGSLPKAADYYQDGERLIDSAKSGIKSVQILLAAIEPYQDFLGLQGAAGESANPSIEGSTTEERINFLVESIESLKPRLDEIETEVAKVKGNFEAIDDSRYPVEFRGIKIKEKLDLAKQLITEADRFIKQGRPLIEKADWLLGKDKPRNYLFLFQNDGELRPTGGFLTAYGIIKVDKGKFSPQVSEDIYALDERFNSSIPAPRPIAEYHKKVYYWYLRDMNLSPDFQVSVEEFLNHYRKIRGSSEFDGVVAIDTQVLVDILKVLGRIGVPGWGNFEAEPDDRCWGCPQVVYQLELLADKPLAALRENRKGFLAPLMHSIISNALGSPKEKVAELAAAVLKDLNQKHMLLYFPDENLQKAIIGLKVAGKLDPAEEDYFHLNNANFAGAKSNLFIEEEVKQEFEFKNDGSIIKKVTVTFRNNAPASDCNLESGGLCLNGLYRNWFRFYLPKGSELIKMTGSEVEPVIYEELEKTVFEGFYGDKYPLYPKGTTRVAIEYQLPFKADREPINFLIQKQPGTKDQKYEIWVNGQKQQEFNLESDKTVNISP